MTFAINATFKFVLPSGLPPGLDDAIRDLAGPRVKRGNGAVWTGYSCAYLVQGLLDAHGVPYGVEGPTDLHVPRPWGAVEAEQELLERLRPTALASWLYDGTADPVRGQFGLARFQREAVWFCAERGGGFLHEVPGSGKTVQSVVWAELMRQARPGPVLVITKNAVTYQFSRQIERFLGGEALDLPTPSDCPVRNKVRLTLDTVLAGHLTACAAEGRPAYVVTGWGSIRTQLRYLLEVPWTALILDESHLGKSIDRWEFTRDQQGNWGDPIPKDTVTAAAYQLAQRIPHRLVMTATPIPNRREDLWAQLTYVELNSWGMTATRWLKRFCDAKPGQHGGLDTSGTSNTEELQARMAFCYHQVPRDVCRAELPPCRVQAVYVAERNQDKPATGFKREMTKLAKLSAKGDKEAKGQLEELQLMEAATRKRTATVDLVEEYARGAGAGASKGKVVVFTGRHEDCVDLGDAVRKRLGAGVQVWVGSEKKVVGEGEDAVTSYAPLDDKARNTTKDAYMAHPGPCVLIGTGYAWGTGLDLHDSDLLVVAMLPFDPGNFEQWVGRVERLGMTRSCDIMLMVATGTVDERKVLLLTEKIADQVKLVNQEGMKVIHDTLLGFDDMDGLLDGLISKVNNPPQETSDAFWEALWN